MLPSSSGSSAPTGRKPGGMRYLKNEDLSTQPKEAKIIAVKGDPDNKFGARVILKMALNGETMFWGVNIKKNPCYQTLEQKFGLDENDWVNQKVLLHLEQDEFSGSYFPRVTFPTGKAGK